MKKLSLLICLILILGCETETPVVEEPVVEEPPPVVMEAEHGTSEDTVPPKIVGGSVRDGAINVDPEPLNRNGIVFEFTEKLRFYAADIRHEDESLGWFPLDVVEGGVGGGIGQVARIAPIDGSQLLKYNTNYTIEIYVQDLVCNGKTIKIKFRTQPQ